MYISKTLDKFNSDQTYRYFPGNTIIKFLNEGKTFELLKKVKGAMIDSKLFNSYVFLPVESYHMTVCDLITYQDLHQKKNFNHFIFRDYRDIDVIDRLIIKELKNEVFELNIKMRVRRIRDKKLSLVPKTASDEKRLIAFRKSISKRLGIDLDPDYRFHISLSYQLLENDVVQRGLIEAFLNQINQTMLPLFDDIDIDFGLLCAFNDMSDYRLLSKGRVNLGQSSDVEVPLSTSEEVKV